MPKRIYVGNIPFDSDSRELRALFEAYGTVEEVHFPKAPGGKLAPRQTASTEYGHVDFESAKAAELAMKALDGCDFGGQRLRVTDEI